MRDVERCPVCDGTVFATVWESTFPGAGWCDAVPYFLTNRVAAVHGRIVRCGQCGFHLTSPQFSSDDYGRIYSAVHSGGAGPTAGAGGRARHAQLARRVRGHEAAGGRFLDFGCGDGAFLDQMADFDATGFEVENGLPEGVARDGRIVRGDILSGWDALEGAGLKPASLDFIVAWDVLEHLADPKAQLRRLAELLKPGGRLYLTLPDMASPAARLSGEHWNCVLLEHLWYFTPQTLARFLPDCGFTADAIGPIGFPVDLGTIARRLRQTYGRWVPHPPRFADSIVLSLPIGLMFAACRKRAD
ncbi:MAG TPA: class I SAM-dependent methyltransferase [Candidatus Omnitrophota bacterium]|nr:class I SAM-dependent methyltransferase [Candidatus Omnitrophota bacterium]